MQYTSEDKRKERELGLVLLGAALASDNAASIVFSHIDPQQFWEHEDLWGALAAAKERADGSKHQLYDHMGIEFQEGESCLQGVIRTAKWLELKRRAIAVRNRLGYADVDSPEKLLEILKKSVEKLEKQVGEYGQTIPETEGK